MPGIFIDPPYNTDEENWLYNDNVNSPIMREWLNSALNKEDMLRHDKWLAMMWPRLKLLHELLAETCSFWMTLDDNEAHRARMMLDEVFGDDNFVSCVIWQKRTSPDARKNLGSAHDSVLIYAKNKSVLFLNKLPLGEMRIGDFKNPDNDERGL